jgi:hypothetical protein
MNELFKETIRITLPITLQRSPFRTTRSLRPATADQLVRARGFRAWVTWEFVSMVRRFGQYMRGGV